uniref:Uncharacterized protein n=1 Tax=Kuenenia stuttgartiensis TaxID=174633 RepID=Q1Q0J3_KUEST|nr:unknown protein [Candidatus Kuenenia stuttgartiensis]
MKGTDSLYNGYVRNVLLIVLSLLKIHYFRSQRRKKHPFNLPFGTPNERGLFRIYPLVEMKTTGETFIA